MIRIAGVILPPNKHIWIALTGIYGIGRTTSLNICNQVKIDSSTKVKELTDHQLTLLQEAVQKYEVEGDLRRHIAMNIKRLVDIKCYRGLRHKKGLPLRGQRTRTNARTRKGRKRQSGTIK